MKRLHDIIAVAVLVIAAASIYALSHLLISMVPQ